MAKQKLSELPVVTNLSQSDLLYIVNQNTSKATNVATVIASISTSNIIEGSNLYFTNARAVSALLGSPITDYVTNVNGIAGAVILSTANILEQGNLYYTNDRVMSYITTGLTTSNIVEGANLYFTDTRAYDAIFDANNTLVLKGVGTVRNDIINIVSGDTGYTQLQWVDGGNLYLSDPNYTGGPTNLLYVDINGINIETSINAGVAGSFTWRFDNFGNILFPDNTKQNTAWNVNFLNTSNILEGSGLYYTNSRVYSNVMNIGFLTESNIISKANVADLNTSNILEGSNLFHTTSRAILASIPATNQIIVSTPVFNYNFDQYAGDNPDIYVTAGETISFELNNSSIHPFNIRVTTSGSNYDTGLTHVDDDGTITTGSAAQAKFSGKLFWKIPYELAGNTYVYQCSAHASMVGNINILNPNKGTIVSGTGISYDQSTGTISIGQNVSVSADVVFANANVVTNLNTNKLIIQSGTHESFQSKVNAIGVVTHDCSLGHIFYHTSPDTNWTVNLTNLNLSNNFGTAVTLVVDQGGTGYYPNVLQIAGSGQTINWAGNTNPTPSVNRKDIVIFSILNSNESYIVFGQLTGF